MKDNRGFSLILCGEFHGINVGVVRPPSTLVTVVYLWKYPNDEEARKKRQHKTSLDKTIKHKTINSIVVQNIT